LRSKKKEKEKRHRVTSKREGKDPIDQIKRRRGRTEERKKQEKRAILPSVQEKRGEAVGESYTEEEKKEGTSNTPRSQKNKELVVRGIREKQLVFYHRKKKRKTTSENAIPLIRGKKRLTLLGRRGLKKKKSACP